MELSKESIATVVMDMLCDEHGLNVYELKVTIHGNQCEVTADLGVGLMYHTQPISPDDRSLPFATKIVYAMLGMALGSFQRREEARRHDVRCLQEV